MPPIEPARRRGRRRARAGARRRSRTRRGRRMPSSTRSTRWGRSIPQGAGRRVKCSKACQGCRWSRQKLASHPESRRAARGKAGSPNRSPPRGNRGCRRECRPPGRRVDTQLGRCRRRQVRSARPAPRRWYGLPREARGQVERPAAVDVAGIVPPRRLALDSTPGGAAGAGLTGGGRSGTAPLPVDPDHAGRPRSKATGAVASGGAGTRHRRPARGPAAHSSDRPFAVPSHPGPDAARRLARRERLASTQPSPSAGSTLCHSPNAKLEPDTSARRQTRP